MPAPVPASVARLARPLALTVGLLVAGTSAALAQGEASPPPSGDPAASVPPGASVAPAASPAASTLEASPPAAYLPLPVQAVPPADAEKVSIGPESAPGTLTVGSAIPFTLGHCGLFSPVDVDGSVWQPLGGHDPAGGAIDSDAEIGELINPTPGEFLLLTADAAEFRSASGVVVSFVRAAGELDYPLCM